jgi:hypothetical protein
MAKRAWSWSDTYPDRVAVTVLMPRHLARAMLDASAAAGHVVAPRTMLIDHLMLAKPPPAAESEAPRAPLEAASKASPRPVATPPAAVAAEPVSPPPCGDEGPMKSVAIAKTKVRGIPPGRPSYGKGNRAFIDGPRIDTNRVIQWRKGPRPKPGRVTPADKARAAEAVAQGKVTRCPPGVALNAGSAIRQEDWT